MAKTKYEVTYIIKPDIDEDSKKALIDRFDKVVTDNGAEELESKDHIMTFVAENSEPVDEFGRLSRIDNQVLRSMTVKLDK